MENGLRELDVLMLAPHGGSDETGHHDHGCCDDKDPLRGQQGRRQGQGGGSAEGQEMRSPWSVVLWAYSGLVAIAFPICALMGGLGERWTNPDPEELWHSRAAILVMLSAVTSEGLMLVSHRTNMSVLGLPHHPTLQANRQADSVLALLSYSNKMVTALYLWHAQGGIVHVDTLAFGGARPVYFGRFLQWSIAIPLLVLLGNRPCLDRMTSWQSLQRSLPSLVASCLYVWAAWLMEVTLSWIVRASMLLLSLFGALFVSLDQLSLVASTRGDCLASYKSGIILYTIFTFVLFAAVFLLGRAGLVTSVWEQAFYAYADATIKVIQSSLLAIARNRQDTELLHRWWVAARTASNDLKNLVEQAKAPVFALDVEGRIVKWNSSLQDLTGLTLDAVLGKRLTEIVTDACRADVDAIVQTTLQEQAAPDSLSFKSSVGAKAKTQNLVEMSLGLDAKPIHLAMSFARWSHPTGELAGLMAIGQDLSTLAELRMVRERRSALMAMLSHELRSPLHGIMGLVGSLLESDAAKTIERQLLIIRGCSMRLLDLMTNAVDLAEHEKRIQEGYRPPRPTTPVNIAAVAEEVLAMVESGVTKMNQPLVRPSVRLVNEIQARTIPLIPGDQHKLSQLLYNLMTNACKFTQRGSVTLSAHYFPERERVEISVRDTGSGISPESQPRIFQAFEQEEDNSGGYQGLGLGLSLCSAIVELHGGDIQLQSERGSGSVFTVSLFADGSLGWPDPSTEPNIQYARAPTMGELPSKEAVFGGEDPSSGVASPKTQKNPVSFFGIGNGQQGHGAGPNEVESQSRHHIDATYGKALILSVDDDDVNQEVIVNGLAENYAVDCAMDGLQAVKYVEGKLRSGERLPDAVLLDIQMPGMTGFEVCEEIRRRIGLSHIQLPIIMVSARVPHELSSMEAYKKGATDYMSKPFDIQLLRHKIAVAVEVRRQSQSAAHAAAMAAEVADSARTEMSEVEESTEAKELQIERSKVAQLVKELEDQKIQLASQHQQQQDQLRRDSEQEQQKLCLQQQQQQETLQQQQQLIQKLQQQLKELQGMTSPTIVAKPAALPAAPLERKAENQGLARQTLRFHPIIKAVSHQLVAACQLLGHCQQQLLLPSQSAHARGHSYSKEAAFLPGSGTSTEKTFSYDGGRSSTHETTQGPSEPARSYAACTTSDVLPSHCPTMEMLETPTAFGMADVPGELDPGHDFGLGPGLGPPKLHLATVTSTATSRSRDKSSGAGTCWPSRPDHDKQAAQFAAKIAPQTDRQHQLSTLQPQSGATDHGRDPFSLVVPSLSSRRSSCQRQPHPQQEELQPPQRQHPQPSRQSHRQPDSYRGTGAGSSDSQSLIGDLLVDLGILQHILSKSRDIVLAEEETARDLHQLCG